TSMRSSQEHSYCVMNHDLYKQIESSLDANQKVQIAYQSYWANGFVNCEGEDAIVTNFTVLPNGVDKL
ncbi:unnamed protein product, partial [marine sediment metagenome]